MVFPLTVPDPVPTVGALKVKVTLLPEIVPLAAPASADKPRPDRPIAPPPVNTVPFCAMVTAKLPVAEYLVSVHVPVQVPTRACEPAPVVVVTDEAVVVVVAVVLVVVEHPATATMSNNPAANQPIFFNMIDPPLILLPGI